MDEKKLNHESRVEDTADGVIEIESSSIVPQELSILKTKEDLTGTDIAAMSDFFGNYAQQLALSLRTAEKVPIVGEFPAADLGAISDAVRYVKTVIRPQTVLLPDFDILEPELKRMWKKGLLHLGESRQVDGNLRAVLVDNQGVRVKDITLRAVKQTSDTTAITRRLTTQLQLHQLSEKIDDIMELQGYQLDQIRDHAIVVPFLNARDWIARAQIATSPEEQKANLNEADRLFLEAENAIYRDMDTTAKHFADRTDEGFWGSLFHGHIRLSKDETRKAYMGYLTADVQIVQKAVGMHVQVMEYLGKHDEALMISEKYTAQIRDFFTKGYGRDNLPTAERLHLYFPYTEENRDAWRNASKKIRPALEASDFLPEVNQVYVISLEDNSDAE